MIQLNFCRCAHLKGRNDGVTTPIYIIFQSHSVQNLNNPLTMKKHIDISRLSWAQSKLGSPALEIKDLAVDMPL